MARSLVVDDDHATVKAMTQLLIGDGHAVAPFTTGAEAVEALSRESFDAVVTDLEMPHVHGHEVVRVTHERQPEACLVVATARADETGEELLAAGACLVTDKPFDYETVTGAVSECRARGGPRAHGRCQLGSRAKSPTPVQLHRG